MAMTPREARTVQFTEDRRGYSQAEVHEYQERVAEALRLYETEVARLKARIEQTDVRVTELEDAEDAVRRTFAAAAQTKREMVVEAEADASRVRREADEAAARLRSTAEEETAAQRSAAAAEAARLVEEARRAADESRAAAQDDVRRLERRLVQLRTSIVDLEERLREFAAKAIDELAVAGSMIDLETTQLHDIEHLTAEPADTAPAATAPAAEAPLPAEAPVPPVPAEASAQEMVVETVIEETVITDTVIEPADEVETVVEETVVVEETITAAPADEAPVAEEPAPPPPVEPFERGPAVGVPVRQTADASVGEQDDDADGSFYERRLAGLRRRIESASQD